MKRIFTFLFCTAINICLIAQIADFENFNLGTDEFLNGSDGSGGFQSGEFFFPNDYNQGYMSWQGFAVSSMTDTTTPGFMNQYSCIAGSGADGSTAYGVSYRFGVPNVLPMPMADDPWTFPYSMMVNNSTWAYFSMLEGDNFAKKFGGVDGNDPDYFLLTIKGYVNGQLTQDSIDFFLADYRFDDNSMDYIVDEWTEINLMPLGHVDSLSFSLASSDANQLGINTPAYFCFDNLTLGIVENANEEFVDADISIYPNPTTDALLIDWKETIAADVFIFSANGQLINKMPLNYGLQKINVNNHPAGIYHLKIQSDEGWINKKILKQ